jgi:hypothetical protein
VYGVWNADTLGTSLDTSIFRVYNGDNVNDTSGNAQNGTNVNNVTFTTGKVGNAFTFNGSNYISLPDNSLNSLTGDFSVACWVKIGSSSGSKMIVGNLTEATPGGARQGFRFEVNGTILQIDISNASGTTSLQAGANPLTVGVWYHVVLTRQGSTRTRIYVNGAISVTNSDTRNPSILPTMYTTIGANRYGTSSLSAYFNGNLDAVTVWNKELTADEVLSLYNEGTGAEYPFSSQLLPSLNDAVGTNNGTRPASTLTGGVPGPSFTAGKIGKAFTFDGINDYVSLPDNSLNLTSKFSYSFWINSNDTTTGSKIVVGNVQSPRSIYGFFHGYEIGTGSGKYYFYFRNGFNILIFVETTNVVNNGNWNHIVVTYDPTNITTGAKIYVNGTLNIQANTLGTSNPIGYSSPMKPCIGARNHSGPPVNFLPNGTSLDALSAWNKELTQADVTELYNAGTGKQYPN